MFENKDVVSVILLTLPADNPPPPSPTHTHCKCIRHTDDFMHMCANPHSDDFEILGIYESTRHKLHQTKEPNAQTNHIIWYKPKFVCACCFFDDFSESPNGVFLTSYQVKMSEMDVSKSLKREKTSLLKNRGEFYSISATVHPRVIIHKNNVKKCAVT